MTPPPIKLPVEAAKYPIGYKLFDADGDVFASLWGSKINGETANFIAAAINAYPATQAMRQALTRARSHVAFMVLKGDDVAVECLTEIDRAISLASGQQETSK